MEKEKTIYDLQLHESMIIKSTPLSPGAFPFEWQVTRVPGGWHYKDSSPSRNMALDFFVTYNNEFQVDEEKQ